LLELKINQLLNVPYFDEIVVSSEDKEILNIAKKMNVGCHERNPKYSTSDVSMSKVYSYLASELDADTIVWVPVTNPLVNSDRYITAMKIYNSNKFENRFDCLLSVCEVKDYLFYNNKPINFTINPWQKSQDLKGLYALTFAICILKKHRMEEWGSLVGNNPYFFVMGSIESTDIDFQEDFDFCEMICKKK